MRRMTCLSIESPSRERSLSCPRLNHSQISSPVGSAAGNSFFSPTKVPHSPSMRMIAPHIALKAAGQNVLTPAGGNSFIGVGSPQAREASWTLSAPSELLCNNSDDSPLRCRAISEAAGMVGMRCRAVSEGSDADCGQSWTTPKSSHIGSRSRAASNVSDARGLSHKASSSTAQILIASPLPNSEVDWLMGTLRKDDLAKFDCKFFVNDCQRRFRELDADRTGLLSLENLQSSLVDMFPTLQLDLATEGHLIPAMHKSIPSLIATFDTDADGYLDFDDFVKFVKFQQAWRAQFFLSRVGSVTFGKTEAHKGVRKCASERPPENKFQQIGSREVQVTEPPSCVVLQEESSRERFNGRASFVKTRQGSSREGAFRDAHVDFNTALQSPVKSPARTFRSSKTTYAPRKNSMMDASRGAFYSSLASFSSTA